MASRNGLLISLVVGFALLHGFFTSVCAETHYQEFVFVGMSVLHYLNLPLSTNQSLATSKSSSSSSKPIPEIFGVGYMILVSATWIFGVDNIKLQRTWYTRLCSTKKILAINGEFPGPTIYANKGDTVIVNFFNKADENVTLHWHGIKQPRNPWYDGPEYITQCPVQPGASFNYTILLSSEEGTMWWHAHSDWTRATVHGAIIIYPTSDSTYPFSTPNREFPIILGSWWKRDIKDVLDDAIKYGGEPNISDAHTINGQPGDLFPCSTNGTYRMMVEQGQSYMLRIVNAGLNSELFFSIAQHNLTVVGRDGSYTKELTTNVIMITPGQTMDVIVKANQPLGEYYMASRPYSSGVGVAFDNTTAIAILQYSGNYTNTSSPSFPSLPNYNDTKTAMDFVLRLKSLATNKYPVFVPQKVDTHMVITVSINTLPCANAMCKGPNGTRLSASMNHISFVPPTIDMLSAYYNNISGVYENNFPSVPPVFFNFTGDVFASNLYIPQLATKVKMLEYNSSVEIVIQGTNLLAGENHPIHLHGYSFYVVGVGSGNFDNTTDPLTYNLVDPPKVNTIGVPKNGWAAIRFTANNPGVWFMHCHLERHITWGMETAFIVKNGEMEETQMLPAPKYRPPC